MATKPHRGKTLVSMEAHGRGTCPICNATRVKILYTVLDAEGGQVKVCKRCRNKKPA